MTITRSDVTAWYEFQRDTRDIINQNDGTNNGPSLVTDSPFDKLIGSYSYNSSNDDSIDVSSGDTFHPFSSDGAVWAWIKTSTTNSELQPIHYKNESATQAEFTFDLYEPNNYKARLSVLDGSGNHQEIFSDNSLNDGNWHLVVAVRESDTLKMYVDGTLQNDTTSISGDGSNSTPYQIGHNSQGGQTFDGQIGQNGVIENTVTSTDVDTLYNSGNGVTARGQFPLSDNSQGYYKLDGTTNDATSNGNDGTAQGSFSYTQGRIGQAGDFNGTDTHVDLPDIDVVSGEFTINAWIKTSSGTQNGNGQMITTKNSSGLNDEFWFYVNGNGELAFHADGADRLSTTATVNDGNWHHVAVTRDSSDTLALYIDGNQKTTMTYTTDRTTDQLLTIGYQANFDQGYFLGQIDEVEYKSTSLTPGEIRRKYSYGTGLRYEDLDKEHPLNDGVAVAWNLDGNIDDAKNNTFDGNTVNGATTTTGRVNDGYDFDGSDDILLFGDPEGIQSDDLGVNFSALVWQNCDNLAENDFQGLMIHGSGPDNDDMNMQIESDGEFRAYVDNGDGGSSARIPVTNYSDNTWILQSNRYDGSTITLDVKEDGGPENTATTSYSSTSLAGIGSGEWGMGGRSNQSGGLADNAYGGELDIGMIYLRDIADTELEALFNGGSGQQFPYTFATENVPGKVFKTVNGVKQTVASAVFDTK